jgi:hypothetical protein
MNKNPKPSRMLFAAYRKFENESLDLILLSKMRLHWPGLGIIHSRRVYNGQNELSYTKGDDKEDEDQVLCFHSLFEL